MSNFDLKKYLAENKQIQVKEESAIDMDGKKVGKQSYNLLDKYLPKMTEEQRFSLYQTLAQFLVKNGIKGSNED
jgi:hypothetical protein